MKFIETFLSGVRLIEPKILDDPRGFFTTTFEEKLFAEHGIRDNFSQENLSKSRKGTLRGLHYQLNPHAQAKLIRVMSGSIFDVAVDIRRGSPTFGRWAGFTLSGENMKSVYVPAGFAHGFVALEDETLIAYKCSGAYVPASDRGIFWRDPKIGIEWPIEPDPAFISEKDGKAPFLDQAEINFSF